MKNFDNSNKDDLLVKTLFKKEYSLLLTKKLKRKDIENMLFMPLHVFLNKAIDGNFRPEDREIVFHNLELIMDVNRLQVLEREGKLRRKSS